MGKDNDPKPEWYDYVANVTTYTASVPCPYSKKYDCREWFSGESTTSQAVADGLATRAANKHAREDH